MNKPIIVKEVFVRQAAGELVDGNGELAQRVNGRIEKAIDIAASGMVFDLGAVSLTPTFLVKSQTGKVFYKVQGRGETWQICSCPDSRKGNRCKHGLAVLFALRATELEKEFRSEWEAAFPEGAREEEQAA